MKNGIINMEIDDLTPCLIRIQDNQIVDSYYMKGLPHNDNLEEWEFDWKSEKDRGYLIYQLFVEDDPRIQGLISLKTRKDIQAIEVNIVEAAPFNNPHNPQFKGKEYLGVGGHLFALAVKQSYECGFDGVVFFTAKTNLLEHYRKTLNAKRIGNTHKMIIDERSARILYERYFKQ